MTIHDDISHSNEHGGSAHFIDNKEQFLRKTGHVKAHSESRVVNSVTIAVSHGKTKESEIRMNSEMTPYTLRITGTLTKIYISHTCKVESLPLDNTLMMSFETFSVYYGSGDRRRRICRS